MRSSQVNKKKIGVFGAGGRMGQELAKILGASQDLEPFLGVDRNGVAFGFTHASKELGGKMPEHVDAWIDFSVAKSFEDILAHAVKTKTPLVSGTTGLTSANKAALTKASKKIPILWASNMSLGVAILNEAIRLYEKLEGFDFQIEEVHHNRKKDRPSGTAITLQETLQSSVKVKVPDPLSIRGGGVYGIHKVWALSEEEMLVFEHQALNRAVFARGAIQAVRWVIGQKPGLYRIQDLLSIG